MLLRGIGLDLLSFSSGSVAALRAAASRGIRRRAKSQQLPILGQAGQARALLGGKGLGVGEQLIDQIQRGFHRDDETDMCAVVGKS